MHTTFTPSLILVMRNHAIHIMRLNSFFSTEQIQSKDRGVPKATESLPLAFTVGFGPTIEGSCYKTEVKVLEEDLACCVDK